jgi:hypothetical protein
MSEETPQSYANHAMMVPGFHYLTCGALALYAGYVLWRVATAPSLDTAASLLLVIGLGGLFWYTRIFALGVQDRVIRLEMRLRLERVLGDDLRPRIGELRTAQLVGLRFASDAELPGLVRQVLAGELRDRKAIKQRIQHWQADHQRI